MPKVRRNDEERGEIRNPALTGLLKVSSCIPWMWDFVATSTTATKMQVKLGNYAKVGEKGQLTVPDADPCS